MSVFLSVLLVAASFAGLAPAQAPAVRAEDLGQLTGDKWSGSLTYLDYGSGRRVSIRSTLVVTPAAGDATSWVFAYEYPDEPKANSLQRVTLGEGGTILDGEKVVERARLEGGALRVVTERAGSDDGRKALFRYTYLFGAASFQITKEVRPEGAAAFFERNRYSWTR
jgi:hypothetical protein